jgi:hypothetical protein
MKWSFAILLGMIIFSSNALADRFQIFPLSSYPVSVKKKPVHANLAIIESDNGAIFRCSAPVYEQENLPPTLPYGIACTKDNVISAVKPGPGTIALVPLAPPIRQFNDNFVAFWKINADTGDVSFCSTTTSLVHPGNAWVCAGTPLPR